MRKYKFYGWLTLLCLLSEFFFAALALTIHPFFAVGILVMFWAMYQAAKEAHRQRSVYFEAETRQK